MKSLNQASQKWKASASGDSEPKPREQRIRSLEDIKKERIILRNKYHGRTDVKLEGFETLQGVSKIDLQMAQHQKTRTKDAIQIWIRDKPNNRMLLQAEIENEKEAVIRRMVLADNSEEKTLAMMISLCANSADSPDSVEKVIADFKHPGGAILMRVGRLQEGTNLNQINVHKMDLDSGNIEVFLQAIPLELNRKKLGKLAGMHYHCEGLRIHYGGRTLATLKPKEDRGLAICSLEMTAGCTADQCAAIIGLSMLVALESLPNLLKVFS